MKLAGYLLLMAGFLAAAYCSVTHKTEVPWPAYLAAMSLGTGGVLLVRRQRRILARSDAVLVRQRGHIDASLGKVIAKLERLTAGELAVPPWELRFEIDRHFREDLALFAEARESLAHIYGLKVYAEVMSAFAAGERYLNRVWSASADGYMEEAVAYLGKALEQFRQASATLEQARVAA